ncbi:MAG: hypothetical protein EOO01_04755, partial [Chitinophagaceae bacterium]
MKNVMIKHGSVWRGVQGALVAQYLCILFGCNSNKASTSDLPDINNYIVDSIYLPTTEANRPKGRIKDVGRGKYAPEEIIAFMRDSNRKVYFYNIGKGVYIDSMLLDEYLNDNPEFEPLGVDSIFLKLNSNKVVRLFGTTKKEWDVTPVTITIGPKVYIGTLSSWPIAVFGDTVFCTTTTSERKKSVGPNLPFLNANFDIQCSIASDTIRFLGKFNPNPDYFQIQDYNANAEKVYLSGSKIVYSLDCSDTLMLHDFLMGITKRVKLKTQNFFPNTPFDHSQAYSMNYGNTYNMSNSRMGMGSLYYDSTRHLIFQLMQHRGRYIEEN